MPFFNARCRERPCRAKPFFSGHYPDLGLLQLGAASGLLTDSGAGGLPRGVVPAESAKATVVKMTLLPGRGSGAGTQVSPAPRGSRTEARQCRSLYQRAQSLEWWSQFIRSGEGEKMANLLDMPLRKMPREKVVVVTNALAEMDLAARRRNLRLGK